MIRPDCFLFGYRIFEIEKEDVTKAAQTFLKNNISVKFYGNKIYASERKSRKIEKILATRVKYSRSELLGLGGFLYKNRKRWGIITALVITVFLLIFSGDRVWDVRIEGCETGNEENIIKELSECGFKIGSRWSKTDGNKIETALLQKSDYVSWLNINRRGTVAYVKVVDKITHEEPDEKSGYANIVASCDAVIEEITVEKGIAMVKAGDTVKKGDMLISGVIPAELGGGFCYAEGTVIGRVSDVIEVNIQSVIQGKVPEKQKICNIRINIFNFSINIFDRCRNSGTECDIIEQRKTVKLFGRNIPISMDKKYSVAYRTDLVTISADEMTRIAADKMSGALNEKLTDATLLRIKTDGEFSDGRYNMRSEVVYTAQIGKELPFIAE